MEVPVQQQHEEISLYDIWEVMIQRKKIIIGIFILIVTATAIFNLLKPKIYRGDAVLIVPAFEVPTSNISARELTDVIGKIDLEKKTTLLPKTYSSITDIRLDVIKDSKDKVQVIIETNDIDVLPQALTELIEYINAIDLLKSSVRDEQKKLLKRSDELSGVIAASTELSDTYSKLLRAGRLVPVGFNPIDLNKRISDIKIEKLVVDQTLQRLKGGVDIAKQLYVVRVKSHIIKNIAISGILSLLIGVSLVFFLDFFERLKKRNRAA